MLKLIRNAALSAMIGLGALAAMPAAASADSLTFHAGNGGAGIGIHIGDRGHDRWRGNDRWRGRDRWHGPRYRACTPRQAVQKAGRMGIRHARIHRASHRSIIVGGRARGHHVRVAFARVPGCPVIR